jgi:hypothetical protein
MWATTTEKKTRLRFGPVRSYGLFRSYGLDLETLGTGSANPFNISMANPEVIKPAPNPFDFQSNSMVQSRVPPSISEVLAMWPVLLVLMFIPTELRANWCA